MFKKITFIKGIFAANIRIVKGDAEVRGDYFEGIPVAVSNDAVMSIGATLAATGRDGFNRPTIYVSEDFFELPTLVARFIILHEFAHVHLGHVAEQSFKNYIKAIVRSSTRTIRAVFGIADEQE
jgi:Zn-dependent protease with chaperone function